MDNAKYLQKGSPVVYYISKVKFRRYIKQWIQVLIDEQIDVYENDEFIYINGFVSGDTKELGLSVVAVDNEKLCILSLRYEPELTDAREQCRTGKFIKPSHSIAQAYCQYAG
jgi:hypothetical protein